MASPRKSAAGEIDLFCFDEKFVRPAAPSSLPIGLNEAPIRGRRYHSVQLAIVTGFFACGGFLCSLFFAGGGDDFPQPHHWLRKSYTSPLIISPPASSRARMIPQKNIPLQSAHQEKTAAQRRQISHSKLALSQTRMDSTSGFRPALDLRARWTNFSENIRERGIPFARNLALDVGRKLRQCYFELGKSSISEDTDKEAGGTG